MKCKFCSDEAHGRVPPWLAHAEVSPVCYVHCAVDPGGEHVLAKRVRVSSDQGEQDRRGGLMIDIWCELCGQRTFRLVGLDDVCWWDPAGGWDPFLDRPYDR